MSSFDRRKVLLGLTAMPLALAGCFRPMLAENSAGSDIRHRIAMPEVDGRFEYFLVESLEDRLGKSSEPEFALRVRTNVTERGFGVAQDNAITRITLLATANWSLWRPGANEPLLRDKAVSQSGFNATTSLCATRQTRLDIERRLARDLGERIARVILARANRLS